MRKWRPRNFGWIGLVLAIGGLGFGLESCVNSTSYTGTDKIDFTNRTSIELPTTAAAGLVGPVGGLVEEVGVLVDGRLAPSGPHVNDAGFISQAARLEISNRRFSFGDIFYPDRRREVVAFTRDRRPELLYTPWTGGENVFVVALKSRREFPATVWILTGPATPPPGTPFNTQRIHAMEAILRTLSIWYQERMGLGFSDVRIIDATTDPDAPQRITVPVNPTEQNTWAPLRNEIGFEAGRLNIYWVDTVNGNTGTGWSNFGPQIVMGMNTGDELLSHEIGHALSLLHINGQQTFDQTNVMHNASNTRQFLTEGQIFRAHMNSTSLLWTLFLDVGQQPPGRDCGHNDANGACPSLNRRIWDDGTGAPANN